MRVIHHSQITISRPLCTPHFSWEMKMMSARVLGTCRGSEVEVQRQQVWQQYTDGEDEYYECMGSEWFLAQERMVEETMEVDCFMDHG